jgi:hypothetical protein
VNSSVTERADSAALGVAFGPPWSTGVPGLRMTSVESVSTLKGRAGARRRCEAGQETCGRLDRPAFDQVQIIVSGRARQPARHKPHRAQHPYALANHVEHPLSVSLREDAVLGQIDHWLALEFVPRRIAETIHDLAAAQDHATTARIDDGGEAERLIAECDRKLAQYRAALDAGANPITVAAWIAETEAEKASCQLSTRRAAPRPRMTEAEIKAIVDKT